ncbi:unnamed protein product, partial [Scytosiphon promiscuus]
HCAGEQHRAAVTADPNYAALVAFESWTGAGRADAESTARNAGLETPPQVAPDAPMAPAAAAVTAAAAAAAAAVAAEAASCSRLRDREAAAAAGAGAADATDDGDDAFNTVVPVGEAKVSEAGLATGSSGREQGSTETPAPTTESEGHQHARGGDRPVTQSARSPLSSRGQVQCASSPTPRRNPSRRLAGGTREGPVSDVTSTPPKALPPPKARGAAGAGGCVMAVR